MCFGNVLAFKRFAFKIDNWNAWKSRKCGCLITRHMTRENHINESEKNDFGNTIYSAAFLSMRIWAQQLLEKFSNLHHEFFFAIVRSNRRITVIKTPSKARFLGSILVHFQRLADLLSKKQYFLFTHGCVRQKRLDETKTCSSASAVSVYLRFNYCETVSRHSPDDIHR